MSEVSRRPSQDLRKHVAGETCKDTRLLQRNNQALPIDRSPERASSNLNLPVPTQRPNGNPVSCAGYCSPAVCIALHVKPQQSDPSRYMGGVEVPTAYHISQVVQSPDSPIRLSSIYRYRIGRAPTERRNHSRLKGDHQPRWMRTISMQVRWR